MRNSLNDVDGPPRSPGTGTDAASGEPLATLDRLPEGEVCEFGAVVDGDEASVLLYREGDAVRAWFNTCPHAGRRLDWSPGRFLRTKQGQLVCAAHGATFELARGECVAGPCRGDSLRAIPIVVRDGAVWLRTTG